MKSTDEIIEIGKQASKLYGVIIGKKKSHDAKITLTGKNLQEWELWQAKQKLTELIDNIVKGEKDNGIR